MAGQGYNFGGEKAERLLQRMREIKQQRKQREAKKPRQPKDQPHD